MKNALLIALLVLPTLLPAQASLSSAPAVQSKTNLAVMDLKAEGDVGSSVGILSDRLRAELFKTGRFQVMERGEMDNILKEQGFQQSGACTDQACIVEAGQLLGVEQIVAGSIGKLGSKYLINLRIVDIKNGKLIDTYSGECRCPIEELDATMTTAARALAQKDGAAAPAPAPVTAIPQETRSVPAPVAPPVPETAPAPQVPGGKPVPGSGNAIGVAFALHGVDPEINEVWRTLEEGTPGRLPLNIDKSEPEFNTIQGLDLQYIRSIKPHVSLRLGIGFRQRNTQGDYTSPLSPAYVTSAQAEGIFLHPLSQIATNAELSTMPITLGVLFHSKSPRFRLQAGLEILAVRSALDLNFNGHWVEYVGAIQNFWANHGIQSSVNFSRFGFGLSTLVGAELRFTRHLALGVDAGFTAMTFSPYEGKGNLNDLDCALDKGHIPRPPNEEGIQYKLATYRNPATQRTETLIVKKENNLPGLTNEPMSLKGPGFKSSLNYYF